ncbi:MAG: HD domain-containing protein [Dehalococcoidia bacterium]
MAAGTALERFQEARAAAVGRASLRPGEPDRAAHAGLAACHELSDALDAGLRELAAGLSGVAVVAVGGYGRREQCRHSDIDVMLLVSGNPDEATQRVLYPLWDAGLKVGHSVRTVAESAQAAAQNVETLTALLDARLVAGDEELFATFERERRQFTGKQRGALGRELAAHRHALVERERWQRQDPNVKTSRGGLRQLQALHWLAAAAALAEGETPPALLAPLAEAQEVLLATRNALHALSDRPNDVYRQDLAPDVAAWLGEDRDQWGRRLFAAMREIDAEVTATFPAQRSRRWWWPAKRAATPLPAPPHGETDLDHLLGVLREPPSSLDPLPSSDWLARLLPEWEVLRAMPHIAPFHRHPVDSHIMRTVDEVRFSVDSDEEGTGTDEVARLLPDGDEPLLAALLHDIGKGHEGDHSDVGAIITERFGSRAGLDAEMTGRLSTVARHHLLLPTVATRRDIADELVVRETASLAGDARTLHLLYLVAVADARASGPDVWSPWKAQLMRTLYERVLDVLSGAAPETATATQVREQSAVLALSGAFPRGAVEDHLRQLPPGYVLSTPPETIGEHLALIAESGGETALRWDSLEGYDRITLVTRDRPGVLSLLTGTLAAHSANVLGGAAYTRDDGVAIDVMHVSDALGREIDERRRQRILEAVPLALTGEFPVDERLAETRAAYHAVPRIQIPTTVLVDNNDSEHYSIIEVRAADRLGLLYTLTRVLHELALDIHLAKVDTIGAEVVDAFYVLRENGRRVERQDEIERLERRIIEAVAALDEVSA